MKKRKKTGGINKLKNDQQIRMRVKEGSWKGGTDRKIRDKNRLVAGGGVHVEEMEGHG